MWVRDIGKGVPVNQTLRFASGPTGRAQTRMGAAQDGAARAEILLLEDESDLAELVAYNLRHAGFEVRLAADARAARRHLESRPVDLAIVDWMLPRESGLAFCQWLRGQAMLGDTPVIMLTARTSETEKLEGFEAGADDYVTKPFSPAELLARVRAVLRRATPPARREEPVQVGHLRLDPVSRQVTRAGTTCRLGPTEFRLLHFLMCHPREVFSREALLEAIWPENIHVELRTVDVHVRRLRQSLEVDGLPDPVRTHRLAGYALDPELLVDLAEADPAAG